MPSPRALRFATDALGLLFSLATGITSLIAIMVAGYWERIMSGHSDSLVCGTTFGWVGVAYYLSSLIVTGTKPQSRFTSLFSASLWRGALLVLGIALTGYLSVVFPAVTECEDYRVRYKSSGGSAANCRLPLAAGILSWITVVVIAASLGYEIYLIRKRYGGGKGTWRTSLAALGTADHADAAKSLNPRSKA